MAFWRFLKSRFCKILSSTRAEYRTDKIDSNEYVINGVHYLVTSCFSKTENKTMKEKISAFIGSDFAHLTNVTEKKYNEQRICMTAGKED